MTNQNRQQVKRAKKDENSTEDRLLLKHHIAKLSRYNKNIFLYIDYVNIFLIFIIDLNMI